jgi:hypothetical protein
MTCQSITAALLSTMLIAGCSDRTNQNAGNPDQNGAATTQDLTTPGSASADARGDVVTPNAGNSAATPDTGSARTSAAGAPARNAEPTPPRRTEPAAPVQRVPEFREVTVPAGSALRLELLTGLSSETAEVETPVRARLRNAVTVDGSTAIPAGAVLTGTVTDVASAGRVKGRSHLTFRFTEVQLDGSREELRTNPLTFQGEATKRDDATKIGVGAGIGAALGGILGGAKGAAKGAAIGGAGGTGVVLATKGKEVEVASGADMTATLARPLSVRVPVR